MNLDNQAVVLEDKDGTTAQRRYSRGTWDKGVL
jgi:hypothetical protein